MTLNQRDYFVWVEKYRPQTLAECILPSSVAATLRGALDQQDLPNLILTGKAGTGKTTVARALAAELNMDVLLINASDESGIDVLRTKLTDFASSMSFESKRKMIILDEADYLNPQSTQPALRGFMEAFASTTTFVLTCNHLNRIIAPLHSRSSVIDFSIPKTERAGLMAKFAKRAMQILELESVQFDQQLVAEVIRAHFPDFRRVLNELQRFSSTGALSPDILSQMSEKDIAALFGILASKDFNKLRGWMSAHEDMSPAVFYRTLSENLMDRLVPATVPEMIIILADYGYRAAFAVDVSLNMLACLTELMSGAQWKTPNGG